MRISIGLLLVLTPLLAEGPGSLQSGSSTAPPPSVRAEAIPPRPAPAPTGSEFVRRVSGLVGEERERIIGDELAAGNLPDFLRRLRPVVLEERIGGKRTTATVWVMPDYLSIGSDEDFVRIPMSFYTACWVAGRFGMTLPTKKIVNAIYRQSAYHLRPEPMKPGSAMRTTGYYATHHQKIEEQRADRPLGELISGHKKDLVLTNRLTRKPPRVAIYGWHRMSGRAIQPLSTVHGAGYADYSHGVRLISTTVRIGGEDRPLFEVLQDRKLAKLLTHEGIIRDPLLLLSPRRGPAVQIVAGGDPPGFD